jgi:hypothetical protein
VTNLGGSTAVLAALMVLGSAKGDAAILDTGFGFSSSIDDTTAGSNTLSPIIVLNSLAPNYNASQTVSVPGASASVDVSLSQGAGNVGLHGSASSSAVFNGLGIAQFEIYSYDLFSFSGSGSETFRYSLVLNANVNVTGDPTNSPDSQAYALLSLYANSSFSEQSQVQPNPGCTGNYCGLISSDEISTEAGSPTGPNRVVTGTIVVTGGSSIELGLNFQGLATNEAPQTAVATAQMSAEDTGYFTLTPVTPGAGFTTQSGLTYSLNPDTAAPEPGSVAMVLIGLAGLYAVRRWQVA